MSADPRTPTSWRAVAIELLRRRAGAAPVMSDEQLAAGGAAHELALMEKRIDGLYFTACHVDHPRQRLYQALWDAQVQAARTVIDVLAKLGVTPIVLKGIEIGCRYDRGRPMGLREDIDLLVPVRALWDVKKALYGMGYVHGTYRPETRDWALIDYFKAARHEANAYELVAFAAAVPLEPRDEAVLAEARRFQGKFCVHDDVALMFVRFDIHHNILFNFDVAPFFERSVASGLGVGRALSPADHLWFAIHRYYYEVSTGSISSPRVLALIAPMVNDPAVDWDLVVANAVGQRAAAPCLYWLTFFHELGAPGVPVRVLDQLRSQLGRSERNWGWQLGRLFQIEEPFPAALLEP